MQLLLIFASAAASASARGFGGKAPPGSGIAHNGRLLSGQHSAQDIFTAGGFFDWTSEYNYNWAPPVKPTWNPDYCQNGSKWDCNTGFYGSWVEDPFACGRSECMDTWSLDSKGVCLKEDTCGYANKKAWAHCDAKLNPDGTPKSKYAGYEAKKGKGMLGCLAALGCSLDLDTNVNVGITWKLDTNFEMACPSGVYAKTAGLSGGQYWKQGEKPPPEVLFCDAQYMACIMDYSECTGGCSDACKVSSNSFVVSTHEGQGCTAPPTTNGPTVAPSPSSAPTVYEDPYADDFSGASRAHSLGLSVAAVLALVMAIC